MRRIVSTITLLAITLICTCPSCAKAPASRQPKGEAASRAKAPMLKMVYIRTSSPGAIKQLKAMHIDIIRVRPDPQRPPDKKSLAGGFIVEAVVPTQILPKLKAKGFDVSEAPPRHESKNRPDRQDK